MSVFYVELSFEGKVVSFTVASPRRGQTRYFWHNIDNAFWSLKALTRGSH